MSKQTKHPVTPKGRYNAARTLFPLAANGLTADVYRLCPWLPPESDAMAAILAQRLEQMTAELIEMRQALLRLESRHVQ